MSDIPYNLRGMPSKQEIVRLAKLLHENGDKVLSASSKLSLSTTFLSDLNEAFSMIVDDSEDIESSFHVCNSSKIDIFRDLKFLHDFVQKTIGLKITHNPSVDRSGPYQVNVDITKFRHLKYLELQKVNIDLVRGLQGVRGQLESVVCSGGRGVGSVGHLLASCGGDAGVGFVWGSLRHLALPYNALARLDKSLELAPWLQTLDLSRNIISKAAEIEYLPNLKNVNLGYNKLEQIPTFNKAALHTLQVLVLKNNYIESLDGLQKLECLSELDLSYNCLMEHSILWPLETMSTLLWVSLEGNPLTYHPKHRLLSIRHLHSSLSDSKFVLDHMPLSRMERQLVSENRSFPIRPLTLLKNDLSSLSNSYTSDITTTSVETSIFNESLTKSQSSEIRDSTERSITRNKKKCVMKEAIITDDEYDNENDTESLKAITNVSINSDLETSMDHLETKKQMLAIREKFGENKWLSSHGGAFVQEIMSLQCTPGSVESSTPYNLQSTPSRTPANTPTYVSPRNNAISSNILHDMMMESLKEQKLTEEAQAEEAKDDVMEISSSTIDNDNDNLINQILEEPLKPPESTYDPEEEDDDLYLVQKKKDQGETEDLFLIVTPDDIKERDFITGKIKYRWDTNTVLSCVLGRGERTTVDIIFDTTRRDRQNRTYFVDLDDAKKIVTALNEKISSRPIMLKVFKCMKCSTHFSQDADFTTIITSAAAFGSRPPKCPTCESTLVIQTDELSTPNADSTGNIKENVKDQSLENPAQINLEHSDSHSSIGGTEGEALSVTTSLVFSDSHPQAQVCCSATSLDESRESTPSANTVARKYESDIEILSNPSQSSIEVLEEGSKINLAPSRKRSSEERRIAVAPSLLTIPDTAPVMAGLTESSSSGSLTDSICTAYENKTLKHIENNDVRPNSKASVVPEITENIAQEKEATLAPVTNLTSMLGGLLQSMKITTSKSSPPKCEDELAFSGSGVQYSYTDFSSIDHRVKLHIILNVLECESEELVLLLRAEILMPTTAETFAGCLVLSTSKVYILRIIGGEGEDPQRWLQKEVSWTMDRLRTFAPLPFKQGILVELQQPNRAGEDECSINVMCILQDFQRTFNFLLYLTELPLPGNCEVESTVPQHCSLSIHNLLKSSKNHCEGDAVRLLAIFSRARIKFENRSLELKTAGLVITTSTLVLMEDRMRWLLPDSKEEPTIATEQPMSNLIEVELSDTDLTLNFLDEVAGGKEIWFLNFVSSDAAEAVINSIQPPWEELFSVPLQITRNASESSHKT